MFEPLETGWMRAGGMTPAEITYPLPYTFHISSTSISDRYLLLFCGHRNQTGPPLVWQTEFHILLHGETKELSCAPSYRTSWCVFTVEFGDYTGLEDSIRCGLLHHFQILLASHPNVRIDSREQCPGYFDNSLAIYADEKHFLKMLGCEADLLVIDQHGRQLRLDLSYHESISRLDQATRYWLHTHELRSY